MISRVYIDNFKCFSSFEFHPEPVQLILGDNGSGKTSVYDVLETLREFLTTGNNVEEGFSTSTLTAWDSRDSQTFEVEVNGNGGAYEYRLVIDHDRLGERCRIASERLQFDGRRLYEFDGGDAHLFRDDGSAGPQFPFDWSRSFIATIPERKDNTKLIWFRERMNRVFVFSPDPLRMTGHSGRETEKPDRGLHQIASWLRHLSQETIDVMPSLRDALRDTLEGMVGFRMEKTSETSRELRFEFDFSDESDARKNGGGFSLSFDALSDGQRNLVALFTILFAAVGRDSSVLIDEADNYVALREIQPWLTALQDRAEECECQIVLISHHPEIINYLAANHGQVFFRDDSGPSRTRPFEWKEGELASPSEIVARGWE